MTDITSHSASSFNPIVHLNATSPILTSYADILDNLPAEDKYPDLAFNSEIPNLKNLPPTLRDVAYKFYNQFKTHTYRIHNKFRFLTDISSMSLRNSPVAKDIYRPYTKSLLNLVSELSRSEFKQALHEVDNITIQRIANVAKTHLLMDITRARAARHAVYSNAIDHFSHLLDTDNSMQRDIGITKASFHKACMIFRSSMQANTETWVNKKFLENNTSTTPSEDNEPLDIPNPIPSDLNPTDSTLIGNSPSASDIDSISSKSSKFRKKNSRSPSRNYSRSNSPIPTSNSTYKSTPNTRQSSTSTSNSHISSNPRFSSPNKAKHFYNQTLTTSAKAPLHPTHTQYRFQEFQNSHASQFSSHPTQQAFSNQIQYQEFPTSHYNAHPRHSQLHYNSQRQQPTQKSRGSIKSCGICGNRSHNYTNCQHFSIRQHLQCSICHNTGHLNSACPNEFGPPPERA